MSHSLIVLPDDTSAEILDPIRAARHMLQIRMFLFTDPTLLSEVIAAKDRGVDVQVMLNPARRDGKSDNVETALRLKEAGILVRDSSPAFAVTHQKSMVIDNSMGFIESLNWETRAMTETRDYAVMTTDRDEVDQMVRCFEADWDQAPFEPKPGSKLIWCPNNGRQRIGAFIDEAKHSLWIQNERYQDTDIIERLVRATLRGVRVHIMARQPHKLKKEKFVDGVGGLRIMQDVGAKVHKLDTLKLHGKMLLADEKRAIVGSINLTPGSFDDRRELAVETDAADVVRRLVNVSHHDWKNSSKLHLSDEAVMRELEKHPIR